MTEGPIGAKTYPAPYEYDDVDSLSNFALFAQVRCFDTVTLNQDDFFIRYITNGILPGDVPSRALQMFIWRPYFSCADGVLTIGHSLRLQQQL